MRDRAATALARSLTVATKDRPAGGQLRTARSNGMFLPARRKQLVRKIEEAHRAAWWAWPIGKRRGPAVLHYQPGTEYKPHYDYRPQRTGHAHHPQARRPARGPPFVMYLASPTRAVGTIFPDVSLEVRPSAQRVFFSYDAPTLPTKTLHGGAPVLAGEKWIAPSGCARGGFGVTATAWKVKGQRISIEVEDTRRGRHCRPAGPVLLVIMLGMQLVAWRRPSCRPCGPGLSRRAFGQPRHRPSSTSITGRAHLVVGKLQAPPGLQVKRALHGPTWRRTPSGA